jgi:dGTPase
VILLAPYACDPAQSRGRLHAPPENGTRGPRDMFQRDRDRIIHSIAFRRLRDKTQVFIAPDGDHYRVRLTHSLEVAQIARTIARALRLNEDLTEALALAHDIGHPPFGHAGEDALTAAMAPYGGWCHNAHTIRTLTTLESPYPYFPGLNLSWEMLEGLAKHNGPVVIAGDRHQPAPPPDLPTGYDMGGREGEWAGAADAPASNGIPWALADYNAQHDLQLTTYASLEAQVAALADDIAYDNHDIDDGLRSGLLAFDTLLEVPFIATSWAHVQARLIGIPHEQQVRELIRDMIGQMVNDLVTTSAANIAAAAPQSADDVRAHDAALIRFSPEIAEAERQVKAMLYAKLYRSAPVKVLQRQAKQVVSALFTAYHAQPNLLPPDWSARLPKAEPQRARHISDFIAGMTDRYALQRYAEHIGVPELDGGF